jgi:hypothetical protein
LKSRSPWSDTGTGRRAPVPYCSWHRLTARLSSMTPKPGPSGAHNSAFRSEKDPQPGYRRHATDSTSDSVLTNASTLATSGRRRSGPLWGDKLDPPADHAIPGGASESSMPTRGERRGRRATHPPVTGPNLHPRRRDASLCARTMHAQACAITLDESHYLFEP